MSNFERFINQNLSTITYALTHTPKLSQYQIDEINHERTHGFKHDGSRDYSKGSEQRNIQAELKKAKKSKESPVIWMCNYAVKIYNCKQNEIEYRNKVLGSSAAVVAPRFRAKKQLMEYKEASKIFWKDFLSKAFIAKNEKFVVRPHVAPILEQLLKYFIQDPSCKLNLNKGIFLFGPVGTSKTTIMNCLSMFLKSQKLETAFELARMNKMNRQIERKGLGALDAYEQGEFCFDDIGLRKDQIKSYGTSIVPSDEIVQMRYDRFTKLVPRVTHYTSNIDFDPRSQDGTIDQEAFDKLVEIYDERSIDRLHESCNFVHLGGKSWRRHK